MSVFGVCSIELCVVVASFYVVGYVFDDCVWYVCVVYLVYEFVYVNRVESLGHVQGN